MALYIWIAAIVLSCLVSQYASQTVDCDFENGPCNWDDHEVVSDPPLNWREVSEIGVLGKDTGHGIVNFVPITATTPDFSVSYLKHTGPNIPGGQLNCLTFDFLATNAQIGFLTIWHYWLNEKNQFYSKKVWSNEEETDGGAWKVGQVLIDGAGNWTLIVEVITNPFNIVIPPHPTGGSGIALDNIKQRLVNSADQCPTLIGPHVIQTTQGPTTVPPPTAPPAITTTQSPTAGASGSVGSISVQLGEYRYHANPLDCDFALIGHTCDLRFTIEYRWTSNGIDRSITQNFPDHLLDVDHISFHPVSPAVLGGPIEVGSVVTVNVKAIDFDDGLFEGGHDDIADVTLQFTVPQAGTEPQLVQGRDDKPQCRAFRKKTNILFNDVLVGSTLGQINLGKMAWHGPVLFGACVALLALFGSLEAKVTCGFTPEESFCGWTHTASGDVWRTGVISAARPPLDATSYAYISSAIESWAVIESETFTVAAPTAFSFCLLQTRFSSTVGVNMTIVPANNPNAEIQMLSDRYLLRWKCSEIEITPEHGPIRIKIQFKVASASAYGAIALPSLEGEGITTIPPTVPTTVASTQPPTTVPATTFPPATIPTTVPPTVPTTQAATTLPVPTSSATSSTCNFNEEDFQQCGWISDPRGFQWSRSDGSFVGSGPYGVGSTSPFLYANSSNMSPGRRSARLVGPLINRPGGVQTELHFNYRIFGSGIDALIVSVESGGRILHIFEDNLLNNQAWESAIVDVCVEADFQIVFEAKFFTPGFLVALDDVLLVNEMSNTLVVPIPGSCGSTGWVATTTQAPIVTTATLPPVTLPATLPGTTQGPPAFTVPPDAGNTESISCNFNNGACGWAVLVGASQFQVGVPTLGSLGESSALFARASEGTVARALSRTITGSTGTQQELQLNYASFGRAARSLSVFLVTGNDVSETPVWLVDSLGSQQPWTTVITAFVVPTVSYRLLIVARFTARNAVIAVDNVVLAGENGATVGTTQIPVLPTRPVLQPIEEAATCHFDLGPCLGWSMANGWAAYPETIVDEALSSQGPQSGRGYLYKIGMNTTATVKSGRIQNNSNVRVSFWANVADAPGNLMDVSGKFSVSVLSTAEPSNIPMASYTAETGYTNGWKQYTVDFCHSKDTEESPFALNFQFKSDASTLSLDRVNLALDDVVTTKPNDVCTGEGVPIAGDTDTVSCDFENDHLCGWDLADGPNRWKLGRGLVGTGGYALNGTINGEGFVYVDSSLLPYPNLPAEIDTHYKEPVNSSLSFYHRTFGFGVISLSLFLDINGTRYLVWYSPSNRRDWQYVEVQICSPLRHKLVFEARFLQSGFVIGLDEITLSSEDEGFAILSTAECVLPEPFSTIAPVTSPAPVTIATRPPVPTTQPPSTVAPIPIAEWNGRTSCDFEASNLCDWRNFPATTSSELLWTLGNAASVGLPSAGTSNFALVKPLPSSGFLARLLSPLIDSTNGPIVVIQFYYRTSGRGSNGIDVFALTSNSVPTAAVWSTGFTTGDSWKLATVSISFGAATRRQIILQARVTNRDSWTAIDDIILHGEDGHVVTTPIPDPTSSTTLRRIIPQATCSFDLGICGLWSVNPQRQPQWSWQNGIAADGLSPQTGRGFVSVNSSDSDAPNNYSELQTASFNSLSEPGSQLSVTVEFWYYAGAGSSSLRISQRIPSFGATQTQFILSQLLDPAAEKRWQQHRVTFCLLSNGTAEIVFRLTTGEGFSPAGLDEIVTYRNADVTCDTSVGTISCDFEEDLCAWDLIDQSWPNRWDLGRGLVGTGPYALNGTVNGEGFVFVDSSALAYPQEPAVLDTQFFPTSVNSILTFYYRAYGYGVVSLTLFVELGNGTKYLIWSTPSDRRDWQYEELHVCAPAYHKFLFEARFTAPGFVVAMDDIQLASDNSSISAPTSVCTLPEPYSTIAPPTTRPTVPIIPTVPTTVTTILLPAPWTGKTSCTFESSTLCDWRNLVLGESQHVEWTPTDVVVVDGVSIDHTSRFAIAHKVATNGFIARMMSPTLTVPAGDVTLQFYYRTSGRGSGGIGVYAVTSNSAPSTPIWSSTPGAFEPWKLATVTLRFPDLIRRQIILQSRFTQVNSWTAIDNIVLHGEDGQVVTTPATIPVTQSPLLSVIPAFTCSFDYGFCNGWTTNDTLQATFTVGTPAEPAPAAKRGYAFVSVGSAGINTANTYAILRTGSYRNPVNASRSVTVEFWYYTGEGWTTFQIVQYEASTGESKRVETIESTQTSSSWVKKEVTLCLLSTDLVQLAIVVVPRMSFTFLGIDEVVTYRNADEGDVCVETPAPSSLLSCSFNTNFCGWNADGFTIEPSPIGGVALASAANIGIADLTTATQYSLTARTQLTFSYNMYDASKVLSFGVYAELAEDSSSKVLWQLNGGPHIPSQTWLPARVSLCITGPFWLTFVVVFEDGTQGRLAINNVVINGEAILLTQEPSIFVCAPFGTTPTVTPTSTTCSSDVVANGSSTFCGWHTEETGNTGTLAVTGVLPGIAGQGQAEAPYFYMIPNNTNPSVSFHNGGFMTNQVQTGAAVSQWSFWFRSKAALVHAYVADGPASDPVLVGPVALAVSDAYWSPASISLPPMKSLTLGLTIMFADPGTNDMRIDEPAQYFAFDNVWYSAEQGFDIDELPEEPEPTSTVSCDFESSFCAWDSVEETYANHWQLGRGLAGTGPYALDGAVHGEGFVFADSSAIPRPHDPAVLDTRYFPDAANSRMSFFYRAYGHGVASLTLLAELRNGTRYVVWSTPSSRRDWQLAEIQLCTPPDHKLAFEARFVTAGFVVGVDYIQLASDDPSLPTPTGFCDLPVPESTIAPVTVATVAPTRPPTTITPITIPFWNGKASCDFESENLCDWRNFPSTATNQLLWMPGNTTSIGLPSAGSSKFAVAKPLLGSGFLARLLSPALGVSGDAPAVLQFFYRTSGRSASGVDVFALTSNSVPSAAIWSTGSTTEDSWKLATISIPFGAATRRQVILQARVTNRNSWTAIDNIVLHGEDGQVVTTPTPIATSPTPLVRIIPQATCSFDLGICNLWTVAPPRQPQWSWQNGATLGGVPAQSGRGFVQVNATGSGALENYSELRTAPFNSLSESGLSVTVQFWHYISDSQTVLDISQLILSSGTYNSEFVKSQAGAAQWRHESVTFCLLSKTATQIIFRLTTGEQFSFAGLDEVVTHRNDETTCDFSGDTVSCDFENDHFCAWDLMEEPHANRWELGRGLVGTGLYALNGTVNGEGFAYVDSSVLSTINEPAILDTRYFPVAANSPMSFYYRTYGHGIVSLTLLAELRNGTRYVMWSTPSGRRDWQLAEVQLCAPADHKLAFEARFSSSGFVVGLDYIQLASDDTTLPVPTGPCVLPDPQSTIAPVTTPPPRPTVPVPTVPPTLPPTPIPQWNGKTSCNFELETLCDWQNFPTTASSALLWVVGNDQSVGGAGHFAVASPGTASGFLARLLSPLIESASGQTVLLQFYYRSNGRGAGGVDVFTLTSDSVPTAAIWSTGSATEDSWKLATVSIPFGTATRRQIILQARVTNRDSWTNVDDIILNGEDGQLVSTPASVATTSTVLRRIIPQATCSFDLGICNLWTVAPPRQPQWVWQYGATADGVSPQAGRGFVAVNTTGLGALENYSELRTSSFSSLPERGLSVTVQFWYHISDEQISLEISQLVTSTGTYNSEMVIGHTGAAATDKQWRQKQVTFCLLSSGTSQIVFRLTTGEDLSIVGLDEVVTFRNDGVTCDQSRDTVTCDFENNHYCAWDLIEEPWANSWELGRGLVGSGPYALNGTVNGEGFVFVDSSALPFPHQPAVLDTQYFATSVNSQLSFYYRAYGHGVVALTLFVELGNGTKYLIWSTPSDQRDWQYEELPVCAPPNYKFVFEAQFAAAGFVVGLDDIQLGSDDTSTPAPTQVCNLPEPFVTIAPPTSAPTVAPITTLAPVTLPTAWTGKTSCDFELNNLCDWRNLDLVGESVNWIATTEADQGLGIAVNPNLHFALAKKTADNGFVSRMMSPFIPVPTGAEKSVVLQFYYRVSGRGSGGVEVYAVTSEALPSSSVWSSPSSQSDSWHLTTVTVPLTDVPRRQIILQSRFTQLGSWTAIDSIVLHSEDGQVVTTPPTVPVTQPPLLSIIPAFTCSFDYGFCDSWTSDDSSQQNFSTGASVHAEPAAGRGFVHVTASSLPVIGSAAKYAELKSGALLSPSNQSLSVTVEFWFYLGEGSTAFEVRQYETDTWRSHTVTTIESTPTTIKVWTKRQITFCLVSRAGINIAYTVRPVAGFTFLGIDEVVTYRNTGESNVCPEPKARISCSFDRGLCGWQSDSFYLMHEFKSNSSLPGYVAGASEVRNDTAALTTAEQFSLKARTQITFAYNLFNASKVLSFGVYADLPDSPPKVLWQLEGGPHIPSDRWLPARVSLCITGPFRLTFLVAFRAGESGQMAIDDVFVNAEDQAITYEPSSFVCSPFSTEPSVTPTSTTCSSDIVVAGSTSFCGWQPGPGGTVGVTALTGLLPGVNGQGQADAPYFYVIPTAAPSEETYNGAVMTNDIVTGPVPSECSFWFQSKGATVEVYITDRESQTLLAGPTLLPSGKELWTPAFFSIPASKNVKLGIAVRFEDPVSPGETHRAAPVQYFAVDNVWYSAEPGYLVGDELPQETQTTVAAPETTVPVVITATTAAPDTPSTASTRVTPGLPQRPSTSRPGLTKNQEIYIGVGSGAGVLALLGVIVLVVYFWKKRAAKEEARANHLRDGNEMRTRPASNNSPVGSLPKKEAVSVTNSVKFVKKDFDA
ncbi:hypothetical protein BV898_02420 [Hypsibius exemplaris]|uniref:MAM domain-containing protein n=1 Tax=Hypsibius exemplaris TaxID=2072580 RepID=A0A1W0X8N2_HYPEX|nr:hypothetical protein BV898_02420 [Hypsibius exemplaris]